MEVNGKRTEAGPSKVATADGFDDRRGKKKEMGEAVLDFYDGDDGEEEEDGGEHGVSSVAFSPGPLLSLKEQIEKDKEDESLRRWKEQLLGCVERDLNGQMEPEVKFHAIGIISDDIGEVNAPLPINEKQSGHMLFTLREGSRYQLKLTFSVLHNIVSGLTFSNTVWKGGLPVDQSKGMLGTFAPQREPYVHTLEEETTPSGILARGNYTAKLKMKELTKQFPAEAALLALVLKKFLADSRSVLLWGFKFLLLGFFITRFLQHQHHHG